MRFVFGEYELEPESRTLQRRGERVPVEPKVFDLFAYLIEHRTATCPSAGSISGTGRVQARA